ncbi:MAG: hypothetical protein COA57_02365 [Flavobacteriales bacterium]|nr:gliding motility-associated C-terminal domain-containing protein [Bacteroidales bacterium AH-315-I05]PCJ89358.1 MAG: hypothetical protein COA57_02365 [Flavobacteriales bacterium]
MINYFFQTNPTKQPRALNRLVIGAVLAVIFLLGIALTLLVTKATAQCPTVGFHGQTQGGSNFNLPTTMACDDPWIRLKANTVWSGGNPQFITPGYSVDVTMVNSQTGNYIELEEQNMGVWYNTGGVAPNNPWTFDAWEVSPSAIHTIRFCETITSSTNMTYTITDVNSGVAIASGTWNASDGICDVVVIPAGTLTGLASYSGNGLFYNPPTAYGDEGYAQFDPAIAGPGTHTITYSWDDQNGCSGTATETITVTNSNDATITAVGNLCENSSSITLNAATSGGTWSGTSVSGSSFDPASAGVGTHIVTYTVGSGSCSDSDTETIVVDAIPDATITSVSTLCTSDPAITLNAATPGGTWSGTGVSGTSFDPSVAGNGTHTITYTVTSGGCTNSDTENIVVVSNPDATINPVSNLCQSDAPVTLSAATAGGIWSGTGISGTTFDPAVAGGGTHIITYTVGSGSCSDSDTVSIVINDPNVSLSSTPENCGAGDGTATATPSGGASPFSYNWSDGQTTQTASVLIAGNYSITITDNSGCTDTASVIVNGTGGPAVLIAATDVSCNGNADGTATATPSGGTTPYTYLWTGGQTTAAASGLSGGTYYITVTDAGGCPTIDSVTVNEATTINLTATTTDENCGATDGTAIVSVTGGTSPYSYLWSDGQTTATANGLSGGNYTVTVTDNNNCTDTASATVNSLGGPSVTTSTNDVTCNGGNDGSSALITSGGATPYSYTWSDGQTDATATGLAAGNYTVTVSDANSCTYTTSISISEPAPVTFTLTNDTSICTGNAVTLTATGGVSYLWSTNDTVSFITVSPASTTTYSVTVSDSSGCLANGSVTVSVTTQNISLAGDNSICSGGNATITANGGTSYLWDTGDTATSITVNPSANMTYYVTATNACGTVSDSFAVAVNPLPAADAGNDITIGEGETIQLSASGGTDYSWSPSADLSCVNCQNPFATPTETTSYILSVTDANGCTATDTITITITIDITQKVIYVPNIFSPNADGFNDELFVRGSGIAFMEFIIYDRWGEKVFETSDKAIGWEGTLRGKPMNSAVFVYVLTGEFNNGNEIDEKGSITLIR